MKMMTKMVLLEPVPHAALHWEMMNGVMNRIVANITGYEPGPDGGRRAPEEQKEQSIKHQRQRNAHDRRHHQALGVNWIIMMHAVNDEMKLPSDSTGWLVVKG